MLDGLHDRHELKAALEIVGPDCVVWDVGAHHGYTSLMLASHSSVGLVVAFEPVPENCERLARNIQENPDFKISFFPKALGAEVRSAPMSMSSRPDDLSSTGGFVEDAHAPLGPEYYSGFQRRIVEVTTGDVVAETGTSEPHLVKIDAEGSELHVLRGCVKLLRRRKPVLLVELHSTLVAWNCYAFLQRNGYEYTQVLSATERGTRIHILAWSRRKS